MLDLGCGDCARVAAALREAGLELSAFTGIDAAAPALAAARQQLAAALPPVCRVTLLQVSAARAGHLASFIKDFMFDASPRLRDGSAGGQMRATPAWPCNSLPPGGMQGSAC